MAIPRNVNGVNPAKVVKDGATMEDHQNIMLQSDDDDFELPNFEDDDALPDFDDAFDDDEKILQEKKASVDENVINLDDNELDKLLGIDEDFSELDGIAGVGETSDTGESSLYKGGAELSPEELDAVLANFDEMDFDEAEEAVPESEELQEDWELNSEESSDTLNFDNDLTNDDESFVELQEDEYDGDSYVVFDEPEEAEEENDDVLVVDDLSEDDFSALMHGDNDDSPLLVIDEDEEDDDVLVFEEDTDTDADNDFDLVIVDDEDEDTDDEDEELDDKTFDDLVRQMNEALSEPEDNVDEEDDVSEDFVIFEDDSDAEKSDADNILSDDLFVFEDDDEEDEDDEWSFSEIEVDEDESDEEDAFTPAYTDENDDEEEFSVPTLSKKKPKDKKVKEESEEPKGKNSKSKPEKKKTDGSSLLDKLKLLKEQIAADLKGEEVPKQLSKPVKEAEPDEEEDENEEEASPKKHSKGKNKGRKKGNGKSGFSFLKLLKSIGKSPLFKIFSPLKKLYLLLVKLCFGLLNIILGILSSLPFVGKFVKPLQAASQFLQKIATYMPIVLVVLGLILFSYMSVPQKVSEDELPDGAALVIQKFKYNDGEPTAVVKNTGEVILSDVSVNFKVYSLQPELNPKTWVVPTLVQECVSEPVSIDIESTGEVSVSCKIDEGYIPRVTGEIIQ